MVENGITVLDAAHAKHALLICATDGGINGLSLAKNKADRIKRLRASPFHFSK